MALSYAATAAVGDGRLEDGMQLVAEPFTMETLVTRVADILRSR